ncbi:MAG: acetyltransferase [Pseudomonadota bacterium]
MSRPFVIWGCSGLAKVLTSAITNQGDYVCAFFDKNNVPSIVPEIPIYIGEDGFYKWVKEIEDTSSINALVAIGGHRGSDRIKLQKIFKDAGFMLDPLIHSTAYVCTTARIGQGSQVLAQAGVSADSVIGDACIINHKASIDHECVLGNGVHLAPGATLCGCVTVGDNVMIGAGSVVLPRLKIGPDSIIGAGAVVTKDVPAGSVMVGNPARLINASR